VLSYQEKIKLMKNSGKELKNHHYSQSMLLHFTILYLHETLKHNYNGTMKQSRGLRNLSKQAIRLKENV
jgi:hypothetical protein